MKCSRLGSGGWIPSVAARIVNTKLVASYSLPARSGELVREKHFPPPVCDTFPIRTPIDNLSPSLFSMLVPVETGKGGCVCARAWGAKIYKKRVSTYKHRVATQTWLYFERT